MALYIETNEEKSRREYEQAFLEAEIELAVLSMKHGIPLEGIKCLNTSLRDLGL